MIFIAVGIFKSYFVLRIVLMSQEKYKAFNLRSDVVYITFQQQSWKASVFRLERRAEI